MACIVFGARCCVTKDEISEKGTQRHGNHDPTIVRHENKPTRVKTCPYYGFQA